MEEKKFCKFCVWVVTNSVGASVLLVDHAYLTSVFGAIPAFSSATTDKSYYR